MIKQFCSIFCLFVSGFVLYQMGGLGITAGVHRLWAHRSYKAKWPLRLMLGIFNTLAFQVGNMVVTIFSNKLEFEAREVSSLPKFSELKMLYFFSGLCYDR